jgi:hypothetical protein
MSYPWDRAARTEFARSQHLGVDGRAAGVVGKKGRDPQPAVPLKAGSFAAKLRKEESGSRPTYQLRASPTARPTKSPPELPELSAGLPRRSLCLHDSTTVKRFAARHADGVPQR